MSFWISDSFTENNLCEVVRGVAGDLVEEVNLCILLQEKLAGFHIYPVYPLHMFSYYSHTFDQKKKNYSHTENVHFGLL